MPSASFEHRSFASLPLLRAPSLVRLDLNAIVRLAARWASEPWPQKSAFPEMHYFDGTERTLNWLFLLDALNFCFWAFPGEARWRVEWRGEMLDGYNALVASLSRSSLCEALTG